MKICVFGAGAIGGYMAGELALAGHEVCAIARGAHLAAIRSHGLRLVVEGRTRTADLPASDDPAAFGPQDVVICALKAQQAHASAGAFAPLLGPRTAVLTAMNGIPWWYFYKERGPLDGHHLESVDPGAAQWNAIGPERAIGCVVDPACEVVAPGVIEHRLFKRFTIGEPDGSTSDRTLALRDALVSAGFDAPIRDTIRWNIWLKLWGNVCFNPISVLTLATLDRITSELGLRALCNSMMAEAKAIAASLGVAIPEQMMARRLNAAGAVVGHKMSMLQDLERGRSLEIDALVTAVQELGRLVNPDFSNIRSASGRESEKASLREGVDQIERVSPMQTECTTKLFEFEAVDRRAVVAGFDGGDITSNAGGLLLGLVDRGLGLVRRFAKCFRDRRDARYVEHQVETIVGQRIFGLVLGYEDLNDHDELRKDPVFKTLAGKLAPVLRSNCEALAGKSTLNRVEHTPERHSEKYKKIDCDQAQVDTLLVDLFLEAHERAPREIVLDFDNTDIPLHGMQEGRFYHAYYDEYCYLPLYVFCGRDLLLARQRCANVAGSAGAVEEAARIIAQIRQTWPRVRITLRADSGFCNDELMSWCEANRVDYVFGLARNSRLEAALTDELAQAKQLCMSSGKPARVFRDFQYRTHESWSRTRRVVGKAEHTLDGSNPRFVVTSLKRTRVAYDARALYEDLYCARGEAENRIGEQFEMFADRASSATMAANQLRMSFSAMAYVLVDTLRRVGLRHSQFADASVQTIRLKLLKLGAQVRTSVRRIHFAIASGCPNQAEFALAHIYLRRAFSSA